MHRELVRIALSHEILIVTRFCRPSRLSAYQSQRNFVKDFSAVEISFTHLLQRVQRIGEKLDKYVLLIADQRSDAEAHRTHFEKYQNEATPGLYCYSTLDRILDTIHFAPSSSSRMLQIADLFSFIYHRVANVVEKDNRAAKIMGEIWAEIRESGKLQFDGEWPP